MNRTIVWDAKNYLLNWCSPFIHAFQSWIIMAGAEQTTYPRMTTIVCLTDLIFALDMPSNECALGLKDRKDYLLRQSRLLKSYYNTEGVCEHKGFLQIVRQKETNPRTSKRLSTQTFLRQQFWKNGILGKIFIGLKNLFSFI